MHQRFKFILIVTALIHGAIVFYKLGGSELIFSTGKMADSLSVRVLLDQVMKKPKPVPSVLKKKVIEKKKTVVEESKTLPLDNEPSENLETTEQTPSQTPQQAFDSLILDFTQPTYPRLAIRRGITGIVILRLFIKNDGSMEKVLISKSSGNDLLDNSALNAVKQWKFKALGSKSQGLTIVEKRIVYKIN